MDRSLSALMRELLSYGNRPQKDGSDPVKFADIAKQYPLALPSEDDSVTRMAHFAEMGYCPYKSFHRGKGTSEVKIEESKAALQRGEEYHTKREARDRDKAKALPKATAKHIRDASINIAEIPELPASIRFQGMIYKSKIERAGRLQRNLTIREIKTGTFIGGPDHLLQTWGYCISAPGILSTKGFAADRIEWQVEYPSARRTLGPFTFTQNALSLLLDAMKHFESMYASGKKNAGMIELVSVSAAKCRPCAFVHDCRWAKVKVASSAAGQY